MLEITVKEFVEAIKGKLIRGNPDFIIRGVSTDTRTINKGDLFIPLSGEKFDGHNFIPQALHNGAYGFITSKDDITTGADLIISTNDPLKAYQKMASLWRKKFNIPFIAITGSNGKTTTKELIATILSQKFSDILKSRENFNNEIGVPKTLMELSQKNDCAVLEFAMRGPGEISELAEVALPDIGVITNTGEAHIGRLGSRENIAKAKAELLENLPHNGLGVLNRDSDFFELLKNKSACKNILTFGMSDNADIYAHNINEKGFEGTELDININGKNEKVFFPTQGKHNIYNLLAATAAASYLIENIKINDVLKNFISNSGRMKIEKNKNDVIIIDDTYNSNPMAVKNMIDTLVKYFPENKKVAILGDMLELGSEERLSHSEIGQEIARRGIDYLLTYGPLSVHTVNSALKNGIKAWSFDDKNKLCEKLSEILKPGYTVLVKGSRGMQMEDIVGFLKNNK